MLDIILERHVVYVLMGIFTVAGLLSKIIVSATLKKLVRAAGNMSKSSHPLMRLVRAKFEHACMVSDKVENVGVFVDKYLYEYRVLGMRIHSLQRVERVSAILCLLCGASGALAEYGLYGMSEEVLRLGGSGAALAIVIYLLHLSTDEKYRLEAARNYMVDYLENVCLHRYEKANQKEQNRKVAVQTQENSGGVLRSDRMEESPDIGKKAEANMEANMETDIEDITVTTESGEQPEYFAVTEPEEECESEIAAVVHEEIMSRSKSKRQNRKLKKASQALAAASERTEEERATENEKVPEKDVLIRQILEEYMA